MKVKLLNTITEIDKELWNSILKPDAIYSSYDHLLAVEKSHINDCEFRYIVFYNKQGLIAHTCIYAISFDLDIFNRGLSQKIIAFIRKWVFSHFLKIKVIECGTPTALGNTICFTDNVDKKEIVLAIVDIMKEYAREKKYHILILRDFVEHELFEFDILINKGFKRVSNLPNSQIICNWQDFDAYLADLTSNYRHQIKRYERLLKQYNINIEIKKSFTQYARRLHELWFQTYSRAREYQREILTPEFFSNMDTIMGEKSKAVLFKIKDKIIAFFLVLLDEETLRPIFLGMDYKYVKKVHLYYIVLTHAVKVGIEENKKIIETGVTSLSNKMSFGAEVVPMFVYMKHLSLILNKIVPNLFSLFTPQTKIPKKHIFNRRYFERIYVDFNITLLSPAHKKYKANTLDMSMRGIRIICSHKFKKSTILLLRFSFPNSYNSFTVKSKVIHIVKRDAKFEIGLQFINVNQNIDKNINYFLRYHKKSNGL